MHKAKKDITKLPKWVQELLKEKDREIERLQNLKTLHNVLCAYKNFDWFNLGSVNTNMILYHFIPDAPHALCSLKKGDILFVGRKPNDY